MELETRSLIDSLRILYCQAYRLWKSNNFRSCLTICDNFTITVQKCIPSDSKLDELVQVKQLIWFLRIKCLAEDYYISESLLLNEDDIEDQEQVRVFNAKTRQNQAGSSTQARSTASLQIGSRKLNTRGVESRHKTGMLTGRMPSVSSRNSSLGGVISSYRPLTTSLTATQTAFSRSTRPLLKYSTCSLLSKPLFEYLYNTQTVNNTCPDYRQCLEYLNMVQTHMRREKEKRLPKKGKIVPSSDVLSSSTSELTSQLDGDTYIEVFWLIAYGTCYFNLRMNKQAEEYFLKAVTINPKYLDPYTWLVKIYLRSNQLTKVLKICDEGLKQSKNSILYNWCARVHSLVGDLYIANAKLKDSLIYYPTNIEALANVGYFSFYDNELEQSLRCFQRIQQLSVIQNINIDTNEFASGNKSQLLNNLALCYFYCGFYHKVVPLFLESFLSSSSKEVTSDIWYNVSFLPLNCGFKQLAIACLRLSLKNNSQNEEATNNLGVLKYGSMINEQDYGYENRQELWANNSLVVNTSKSAQNCDEFELENMSQVKCEKLQALYNVAETYFSPSKSVSSMANENSQQLPMSNQPESIYNMALIKRKRGHLFESVKYCRSYLEHDPENYHIINMIREIEQLVLYDGS